MKKIIDKLKLMTHVANCMVTCQAASGPDRDKRIEMAHTEVMEHIMGHSFPEPDKYIHTKCPKCHGYVNPLIAVDLIVWMTDGIVLIERKNPPYGWALPGGFVDVGETLDEAARRELKEETNLEMDGMGFFRIYDAPDRDPRFHTISSVYYGSGRGIPKAGDDAGKVEIFQTTNLPELVFDHETILNDYFGVRRKHK